MRVASLVVAFALLLVLAGCVGPFADDGTPTADVTETPTGTQPQTDADPTQSTTTTDEPATGTDDPTTTETDDSPTATPTHDPDLSADNPFGQEVVPVRVNDSVQDGRDTTALASTAIDYWNTRIDRYTAFNYRFELAADPDDARVEIRYVDSVDACGRDHDERAVGCAPLLDDGSTAPDVAVAEIELHGSNSAVVGTVEHELGHILGLRHDDPPLVIMGFQTEESVTDAMDRAVPWFTNDLGVYVDHESLDGDRDRIEAQIDHTLQYYNGGAEGTIPDNVTFTRTDHEASADIVVTNDEQYPCGGVSSGSEWALQRYTGIDTDPAPELYVHSVICVDIDEETVGWHVGHWLGQSMGLAEDELPDPLRDADYQERRSEWWN